MFVIGSGERRKGFFSLSDMISYSHILVQGLRVEQANWRRAQMVLKWSCHDSAPLLWKPPPGVLVMIRCLSRSIKFLIRLHKSEFVGRMIQN